MKSHKTICRAPIDVLLVPWVYLAALLRKGMRRTGVSKLRLCWACLPRTAVFLIRNHNYEPQSDFGNCPEPASFARQLPGIDRKINQQLGFLANLNFADELAFIETKAARPGRFTTYNGNLGSGDADCWYQMVRFLRPGRINETGSGYSTLVAAKALQANRSAYGKCRCRHMCSEPYDMPWLETTGASVLPSRGEDLDPSLLLEFQEDDVLFIESPQMVRRGGKVMIEYLQIVRVVAVGIYVLISNILTSRRDLPEWLAIGMRFCNEQSLTESTPLRNVDCEILSSLNLMHHQHYGRLKRVALFTTCNREPGSSYMRRVA